MKDRLTDANFPRTADQRVYHLGLRHGEVANRIITVGSPSRARAVSEFLDNQPKRFELYSERGFLTITGRYQGVPISIVSIGMGSPNMDFFVREIRECLQGDMVVVRLGSCGALVDVPVGSVVIPQACVAVNRNVDFDFSRQEVGNDEPPYRISKLVPADQTLHKKLAEALQNIKPRDWEPPILPATVNASADSFYSSQGRQTSFPDQNSGLIDQLLSSVEGLATLEMETFHLYHLAACWNNGQHNPKSQDTVPLTAKPVEPVMTSPSVATAQPAPGPSSNSTIRAAGVQMVFASRLSQDFIIPEQVTQLEKWTGRAVLDALTSFEIPEDRLESEQTSVWKMNV